MSFGKRSNQVVVEPGVDADEELLRQEFIQRMDAIDGETVPFPSEDDDKVMFREADTLSLSEVSPAMRSYWNMKRRWRQFDAVKEVLRLSELTDDELSASVSVYESACQQIAHVENALSVDQVAALKARLDAVIVSRARENINLSGRGDQAAYQWLEAFFKIRRADLESLFDDEEVHAWLEVLCLWVASPELNRFMKYRDLFTPSVNSHHEVEAKGRKFVHAVSTVLANPGKAQLWQCKLLVAVCYQCSDYVGLMGTLREQLLLLVAKKEQGNRVYYDLW